MKTRKKKIMRMVLIIMMVGQLLALTLATSTKNDDDSSGYFVNKQRTATGSSTRGFRPNPLSTASGFGKRMNPFNSRMKIEYDRPQYTALISTLNPTKRTTTYWYLQHVRRHPELSRKSSIKIELSNSKKNNRLIIDQLLKLADTVFFF